MRIGLDAHTLGTGAGGNETYMRNLLHSLRECANGVDLVAFVHKDLENDPGAAAGFPTHLLRLRSSYLRVPFELPYAAKKARVDLLHVQYTAPPVTPCPYVVSMHDVVYKRFPESLPAMTRYRLALLGPGTMRRAARIFVLTDAQRKEIAETYHIPEEKFDLVQPSLDPNLVPCTDGEALAAVRRKYNLPDHYVAYLGALQPRKNLGRLTAAFAKIMGDIPHKLVIIGKRAWLCKEVMEQIEAANLGDRLLFTDYASQSDLPFLLSAADGFAYVSLYEGFGIPVVEALACGVPVLASTDPAILEVAGGSALHVDPLDVEAIAQGILRIVTDTSLREKLREAGPERAAYFSREQTARAAMQGYERALG